jgi:hypothetical protein
MKSSGAFLLFFFLLLAAHARAEPIPDYILNKDLETCRAQVSKAPNGTPEQKEKYCLCIRNNLARTWDLDAYGRYVIGHVFGRDNSEEDGKMKEMAKECMAASAQ